MGKYDIFEYLSQKQLGELFGVGPKMIGRWLVDIGLRTRQLKPSLKAQSEHFVKRVHLEDGSQFDAWHQTKTVAALRAAGHRLLEEIESTPISGPFLVRSNEGDGHEIIDANGSVCVWVRGAGLAEQLRKMMDLADQHSLLLPGK